MTEKKAKKSELEKFTEFAELATKKIELIEKEDALKKNLENLKKQTAESYTIEKAGAKPVAPQDVNPVLDVPFFIWGALGILLIVAPIILFIVGVNMQATNSESDPMGVYTIVFILIVLAVIFDKRCFENAGDVLDDYKKDVAIHNEYPTQKYQYDAALKKWNGEYAKYKKERESLIAQYKKELEEISAQLLEVRNAINEEYKTLEAMFFENGERTDDEEIEELQKKFKEKKDFLAGVYSCHRSNEHLLSDCNGFSEYGKLFSCYEKPEKKDFFCEPLVELMKKKLAESKRGTIIGCANKIIDGLNALVLEWQRKSCAEKDAVREERRKWELCESCWNFKGGRCPMAPKQECNAYISKYD